MFNKNKKQENKNIEALVLKDYYLQSNKLSDLFDNESPSAVLAPTYLAGLHLLAGELSRFKLVINDKNFVNLLGRAKIPGQIISGEYEVLRYIYLKLLDTGRVGIVVYNDVIITDADTHSLIYNKNGEYAGIEVNGVKINKDRVILINLSDTKSGGFRDWLKDVIALESHLLSYMSAYAQSYGLFGAYKVQTETLDDRTMSLLQSLLAEARKKMKKGVMPVLPAVVEPTGKEMGWQAVNVIQDYIVKTTARVMGIPLLALQAREGGAYALAKEERAMWYETFLQGYVELVRSAIEKWLKEQVNSNASVVVDSSSIDYLNEKRTWTANEVSILLSQGVVDTEEARRLLQIETDVRENELKTRSNGFTTESKQTKTCANGLTTNKQSKKPKIKTSVYKQIVEEDSKVHQWHAETIQPLERVARDDLLSEINKAIRNEVYSQVKSLGIDIKKSEESVDLSKLNSEAILEAIDKAITNTLTKQSKRAIKRALTLQKTLGGEVYVDPEKLYEGLVEMIFDSAKYIGQQTSELVAWKVMEMRNEQGGYNWEGVVEELQKTAMTKERATTIARTEINRACAYAHEKNAEEMKKIAEGSGMLLEKRWSTALDEKVRESHVNAGLQGWIPYDEKFSNGLMRPYEPGSQAKEVVNCRCVLLTRFAPAEE